MDIVYPTLLFCLFFGSCAGLTCKICRHSGLSMVPPKAPNSRFIFNSRSTDCEQEDMECTEEEDFCLAAYAQAGPDTFWVQKGCVASTSGGRGSGCKEELLDLSKTRILPVRVPKEPLRLSVCVCNTHDNCNQLPVLDMIDKLENNGHSFHSFIPATCLLLMLLLGLLLTNF